MPVSREDCFRKRAAIAATRRDLRRIGHDVLERSRALIARGDELCASSAVRETESTRRLVDIHPRRRYTVFGLPVSPSVVSACWRSAAAPISPPMPIDSTAELGTSISAPFSFRPS